MSLFPTNFLISWGIYSTPKLSKQVTSLFFKYKAIECVPVSVYSSRFITYAPFFIVLGKLFLEYTPLNLGLSLKY